MNDNDNIGIYKITNKINNKSYIGQSINLHNRKIAHFNRYKNKNDSNYESDFYNDLRKYGLDNFKYEILEYCKKEELNDKEIYWIKYYDSFKNGYNKTIGGSGSNKIYEDDFLQYIKDGNLYVNKLSQYFGLERRAIGKKN